MSMKRIGPNKVVWRKIVTMMIAAVLAIGGLSWPASAAPAHRALLIGINKYSSPDVPALGGSCNDVAAMRQVLLTRYGFEESEIRTLLDEQATRAGILQALRDIVQQSSPGDIIYIHFSGHGSQVKDANGDEPDGLDETIVPYDGRTSNVPDITDDELGEILGGLKSNHVLVILDSCHSGTGTRSVTVRTRSIPKDTRDALYVGAKTRALVPVSIQNYILMTGASAGESALDGPLDGACRGFFSYALGRVLSVAPSGISPDGIHAGVKLLFQSIQEQLAAVQLPEPQIEGSTQMLDQPIFEIETQPAADSSASVAVVEGEPQPDRAYVEIRPAESGVIVLVGGVALGAVPGSRWAVYRPDEQAFESDGAVATARVSEVRGEDALARTDPADAVIENGARAILICTAPPADDIPVELRAPEELGDGLKAAVLNRLESVRFVPSNEFARFLVEVIASDSVAAPQVHVYGAGGLQAITSFAWDDEDQVADRLVTLFARSANAAAIKTLSNPATRMNLDVRIVTSGSSRSVSRGVVVVSAGNAVRYRIRRPGEPRTSANSLTLEILSDRDCYLSIVDIDAQGGITMLFPNAEQNSNFIPNGLIRAGKRVHIPDALQEPNKAGFLWDYGPPSGTDVIQVFATTDVQCTRKLREYIEDFRKQGGSRGRAAAGRRDMAQPADPLEKLRGELASLATERGINVVSSRPAQAAAPTDASGSSHLTPAEPGDWISVPITIEVTE